MTLANRLEEILLAWSITEDLWRLQLPRGGGTFQSGSPCEDAPGWIDTIGPLLRGHIPRGKTLPRLELRVMWTTTKQMGQGRCGRRQHSCGLNSPEMCSWMGARSFQLQDGALLWTAEQPQRRSAALVWFAVSGQGEREQRFSVSSASSSSYSWACSEPWVWEIQTSQGLSLIHI